jgi:drug/metabolite transporter superfamily protein YnfA
MCGVWTLLLYDTGTYIIKVLYYRLWRGLFEPGIYDVIGDHCCMVNFDIYEY